MYSLQPVELKILKTYIKANLANDFIILSKSPTNTPIIFIKKFAGSFSLYINEQDLINLTI